MPFQWMPHGANEEFLLQQRKDLLGLGHRNHFRVDTKITVARMRHLQPVEPVLVRHQHDTAGDMAAGRLAGKRLDLLVKLDGVFLQLGDVGIAIERVEATGRMPGSTGGEFVTLDQRHVAPASAW